MVPGSKAEIGHRFAYHPPKTAQTRRDHEHVRDLGGELAETLRLVLPDGREKALAYTKLEETMLWANAAIARG